MVYLMTDQPIEWNRMIIFYFIALLTSMTSESFGLLVSSRLSIIVSGIYIALVINTSLCILFTEWNVYWTRPRMSDDATQRVWNGKWRWHNTTAGLLFHEIKLLKTRIRGNRSVNLRIRSSGHDLPQWRNVLSVQKATVSAENHGLWAVGPEIFNFWLVCILRNF